MRSQNRSYVPLSSLQLPIEILHNSSYCETRSIKYWKIQSICSFKLLMFHRSLESTTKMFWTHPSPRCRFSFQHISVGQDAFWQAVSLTWVWTEQRRQRHCCRSELENLVCDCLLQLTTSDKLDTKRTIMTPIAQVLQETIVSFKTRAVLGNLGTMEFSLVFCSAMPQSPNDVH